MNKKKLGKIIREKRRQLEYSQSTMAQILFLDQCAISNIEQDKRELRCSEIETLIKYNPLFKKSIIEYFNSI